MKIHALVRESAYAFDHQTTVELFTTKELAKAAFDEAVKEAKGQYWFFANPPEPLNELGYEWHEDENSFFVSKAGRFAEEHISIRIEEKEVQGMPRLEIPAGSEGDILVAEVDDRNLPEIPAEFFVYREDRYGCCVQNVALIRPQYKPNGDGFITGGDTEVFVWGDEMNEDFTDIYEIPRAEVEE